MRMMIVTMTQKEYSSWKYENDEEDYEEEGEVDLEARTNQCLRRTKKERRKTNHSRKNYSR
jgi:heme/copper-type cytochrome/quinol oxidase subunit 2